MVRHSVCVCGGGGGVCGGGGVGLPSPPNLTHSTSVFNWACVAASVSFMFFPFLSLLFTYSKQGCQHTS